MQAKRCTKCGETKPATEFYRDRKRADGLFIYCKACVRQANRDAREDRRRVAAAARAATVATLDPAFGHWLAGLLDGEGHFAIKRIGNPARYACTAQIGLRDDDRTALNDIRSRTRIGAILTVPARRSPTGGVQHAGVIWLVSRKADCLTLVALFDRFQLRSKKARDYAIWRDAVLWWSDDSRRGRGKARGTAPEWGPMLQLKERLEAGRAYAG